MQMTGECMRCIYEHHWGLVERCADERKKLDFMREVSRVLATCDTRLPAPIPTAELQAIYARMFGLGDAYAELKVFYNDLLLKRLPRLRERVREAADPLKMAVWMAMAGNYIDFGILKEVDDAHLMAMLESPDEAALNPDELETLRGDLSRAERLVYCLDNCGEAVLDRIFIEVVREQYPHVRIAAMARGCAVLNDVTVDDARAAGIDSVAEIIGNGCAIGGTPLALVGDEAREALVAADVIIAKGQGNFETLLGSGLNVYYLLLAKCPFYARWFGMEHMRGQIVNERRFFASQRPVSG